MPKFQTGDEIVLAVDPWVASGSKEDPYHIMDKMWKRLAITKRITVRHNIGQKSYGGYRSNNAISIEFEDHNTDNYVFPEEFFMFKTLSLFSMDDDFLI